MNQAMQVLTSMGSTTWHTPPWLLAEARAFYGGIDLDPASSITANVHVGAARIFTPAQDGLKQHWSNPDGTPSRVWLNPPFDNTPAWIDKVFGEYQDGHVEQALVLVNSAPGYIWWEALWNQVPVVMFRHRLHFARPDGTEAGPAKKGQTLAYFGPHGHLFGHHFAKYGRLLLPGRV